MAFLWFIKTAGFFNTAGKRCGNAILVKSTNGVQKNKMLLIKENIHNPGQNEGAHSCEGAHYGKS